jgi:murein DD-endopeptidase MepM/ murein hydrolase activator NlpD
MRRLLFSVQVGSARGAGRTPQRGVTASWMVLALFVCSTTGLDAAESSPHRATLVRAVDLDLNETQEVELANRTRVSVKLLALDETRDPMRDAVRQARVTVEVNGQSLILTSATYHLPVTFAGVQIDCPITKGHVTNSSEGNAWGLLKGARLRLWPAGSPWIEPGTFVYPLKQRWFASHTQMANEPSFVDGGEVPANKKIYYHYGLDCGGAEGMVDVVAATAGRIISAGKEILPGYDDSPAKPRYDVIYLLDDRGWFYRYSHLQMIDAAVRPGAQISLGQKIGVLGKEGGSGGWSHLHFDITSRQPSGLWGIQEGYAFLWEACQRQYAPKLIAVARPHHFVLTGDKVTLDGSKSWSASGKVARYDWTFTDGTTASGPGVERTYSESGEYSEILKVSDARGEVDYDFTIVLVIDKAAPDQLPPTIHPACAPTMNIRAGDPVTFKVRSFRTTAGKETWDFGDGSEKVAVKSDGNVEQHAPDGYAVTQHRFAKPGHYLVRVERTNENGQRAIGHLHVPVESKESGR